MLVLLTEVNKVMHNEHRLVIEKVCYKICT